MKILLPVLFLLLVGSASAAIVCTNQPVRTPLQDSSGNGFTLTYSGAPVTYNSSQQAYAWNGSSFTELITGVVNATNNLSDNRDFTLAVWVFCNDASCGSNTTHSAGLFAEYFKNGVFFVSPSGGLGRIGYGIRNTTYSSQAGNVMYTGNLSGKWWHVMFDYNSTSRQMRSYVNNNNTVNATAIATNWNSANNPRWLIGGDAASISGNLRGINGTINNAGVWGRVLTPEERQALINNQTVSNAIMYYEFNNQTPCYDNGVMITSPGLPAAGPVCSNVKTVNNLSDSSGNNYNIASVVGSPAYSQGSYNFNGTNSQYLNISSSATFDFINLTSEGFTVTGWVNYNNTASFTSPVFIQIRNTNDRLVFGPRSTSSIGAGYWNGTSYVNPKSATGSTNSWLFLAYSWNTTNSTLFVNDVEATGALTPSIGGTIGTSIAGDRGTRTLNGSVSDVRVFNRYLTPSEINTVYQNGTISTGLVAQYLFTTAYTCFNSNGVGISTTGAPPAGWVCSNVVPLNNLSDASGNGYTLINQGGSYDSVAQRYNFSLSSTYLNASNSSAFLFDQDFTLSFCAQLNETGSPSARVDFITKAGSSNSGWYVRKDTNANTVFMFIGNGSFQSAGSVGTISNNVPFCVAYSKNGTTYTRYFNGALVGSTTLVTANYSPVSVRIGSGSGFVNGNSWVDDFRVWSRPLSATEVANVHSGYNVAENLTAWWPFTTQGPTCRAYSP